MKPQLTKFLFIFLFLLVLTPLALAQPPLQQNIQGDIGLTVESPIIEFQQNGEDFIYDLHVFNITDGVLMTNDSVACVLHLFNSTGDHLLEIVMPFDINGIDFQLRVEGGNFTDNAAHAAMVNCNVTDPGLIPMGGFLEWSFVVTPSGDTQNSILNNPVLLILLLLGITFIILAMYNHVPTLAFIGSMLFIVAGMYAMIYGFNDVTNLYTRVAAGTILGVGFIFMIVSAYEWVLESRT